MKRTKNLCWTNRTWEVSVMSNLGLLLRSLSYQVFPICGYHLRQKHVQGNCTIAELMSIAVQTETLLDLPS